MQHLADVQDALRSFLGTLLSSDAPLQIDTPIPTRLADAHAQSLGYVVIEPTASALPFAVMLDGKWMGLLSEAVLGERMSFEDTGADDLLMELAAQGYGAVRSSLAAEGVTLPDVMFQVLAPGRGLTKQSFANDLLEVPFGLKYKGAPLGGFALIPAPAAAPKSSGAAPSQAMPAGMPAMPQGSGFGGSVQVAPAAFPDLGAERVSGDGGNFELLAQVELEVTVELGRRRLPLADALRLTTGSVIELEKLVGEPLEVYANGRLIAEGEAVVIDDQFGIRITSLAHGRQRAKAFL